MGALTAALRAPRLRAALPWIVTAVALATIAAGLALDAAGIDLGLPHPPLEGGWQPRVDPWILVALPCFAAAVGLAPRLFATGARPAAIGGALFAVTLVLRLALAAARDGTGAWDHVFTLTSFEGRNEYLPALPAFRYGTGFFLDRFAQLVPSLPVHAAGHGPGLLLTMHALALDTPGRLAAFCIVGGALSAPLAYALGRRVLDERGARVTGGLMTLAPGALLFGVTSADALYLTLGLLAAWPLLSPRASVRALGGALLGAASLFAWSLLAIGVWAVLLVALRDGPRPAIRLALTCAVALLAVQGLFAVATGFDPLGTLHATSRVYALGIASRRPYAFWLFGSPAAFLLVLGLPIAWLATRRAAGAAPEALAIAAVIAASALIGFTKAETERIWLFLAPFVCLAAAPLVRRPRALAGALAAQALVYSAVWFTVW
jgi:hypothetical protein